VSRNIIALAAIFIAALLSLSSAGPAAAQTSGPLPKDIRFEPHPGAAAPLSVELTDESGRRVRLGDHFRSGRPVILVLAYYECPMLCSMVLNGLVAGLKQSGLTPGEDFEVVVASIDPADTPERASAKKASYVSLYDRPGAERALHFTTGEEAEVQRLAGAVGFKYEYDPIGRQFAHPAGVVLLTPDGTISRYLYGLDFAPRDLRLGLVEAANGAVGSTSDRLMLLCFRYDPAQGRYGAIALGSVRAGGVITAVLLAAFIVSMLRRPRGDTNDARGAARRG
jgi:protein SCO1